MSRNQDPTARWTQYTLSHRQERRAALVCTICHAKKIKCDLQVRRSRGATHCSYCLKSGKQCQARSPKRRKKSTKLAEDEQSSPTAAKANGAFNSDSSTIMPVGITNSNELPRPPITHRLPGTIDPAAAIAQPGDRMRFHHSPIQASTTKRHSVQPPSTSPAGPLPSPVTTNSQDLHRSGRSEPSESHKGDVDTGFLSVYRREHQNDARIQALKDQSRRVSTAVGAQTSADLLNIFAETYFGDCYAWCPVLDRDTLKEELADAPILQHALASLGSHVRPPMLPHEGPAAHYDKARRIFYDDEEPDTLTCLKAILLFYWWAPRPPTLVHRHSSWWWTSVVIRHAQQMSIHRASKLTDLPPQAASMWRRVWWTAFARERLTALCQSKPPIINAEDCSIPEPTLEDFPLEMRDQPQPLVFIYWVRLCSIIGRIATLQSRSSKDASNTPSSPLYPVAEELVGWVQSLPATVRISLASRNTSTFNKDVHQMHIPYLASVIVLNLKHAPEPGALPLALPPAIFAASCIARIYKDILAKGDMRFLMPITSWYCAISFTALLRASRDPTLGEAASADLDMITLMCDQLRKMWASSQVIFDGFDRLRAAAASEVNSFADQPIMASGASRYTDSVNGQQLDDAMSNSGPLDWMNYFPFATGETSRTVELLLELRQHDSHRANTVLCSSASLDPWDWLNDLVNTDFTMDNELLQNWIG